MPCRVSYTSRVTISLRSIREDSDLKSDVIESHGLAKGVRENYDFRMSRPQSQQQIIEYLT